MGTLLAPLAGAVLVRTQHFLRPASLERSGNRQRASLALHRSLNRRLRGYVAISATVAEAACLRREVAVADIVVIPPAIQLPDERAVSAARAARHNLAAPVVAFAGRLVVERRLDRLIRAMPLVLERLPACRLIIAGTGEAEEHLKTLAAALGVQQAITWAGWVAEPYSVLARAHVYVNTWSDEGFGMAMAEAMTLAMPVIAVRSGANVEMVQPGVTGLLVAEDDADDLASAIVEIVGQRERAAVMGERARERALSLYGARRTAQSTLIHYERLLDLHS